jgi:hypothetical protein
LAQDPADSTHWTGTITVPGGHSASEARLMVQAVNGVGLVALDDNFGAYHKVPAVGVAPQSITFATISDAKVTDPDFTISPTSSAGLAVALNAAGPCTVSPATSPATIHITGAGSCSITASQAGNATVEPATSVTRTFTISKLSQTITFGTVPTGKVLGDADFTVTATASSGLAVALSGSGACTVTGTTVHITAIGTCSITATQPGNGTYSAAPAVTVVIPVIWPFTGFFPPVDNLPTVNKANAGQAIPIKFSLGGDRGLAILRAGYPKAVINSCSASTPTDDIETYAAGSSGLQYGGGQYTYVWKTDKSLAGKCVQFQLGLIDGNTVPVANFKFK